MSVQTDGGLNEDDRAYVLEKVRGALLRFGASNYGELAGLLKDAVDRRFGSDWQCVVGRKEGFGSCLSQRGQHLRLAVQIVTATKKSTMMA
jgi:hypothetical protein